MKLELQWLKGVFTAFTDVNISFEIFSYELFCLIML